MNNGLMPVANPSSGIRLSADRHVSAAPIVAVRAAREGLAARSFVDVSNIARYPRQIDDGPVTSASTWRNAPRFKEISELAGNYGEEGSAALERIIANRPPWTTEIEAAERFATATYQRSFNRSLAYHDANFADDGSVPSQSMHETPRSGLPPLPLPRVRIRNPIHALCVALNTQHQLGLASPRACALTGRATPGEVWERLQAIRTAAEADMPGDSSTSGDYDIAVSDPFGTGPLAGGALKDWARLLVRALDTDPCEDFDEHVNGVWRLEHPASDKRLVSAWNQRLARVPDQIIALMQRDPSSLSGAGKAIADVHVSAMKVDAARDGLMPFQPALNAIAALKDAHSIGNHICDGISNGKGAVLGISALFGMGVLGNDLPMPRPAAFYALGADHEQCKAYIGQIAAQLVHTGMDATVAADRAKTVFGMEARLVGAGGKGTVVDRRSAQRLMPGFPWMHLWDNVLRLKPGQALYVQEGFCNEIGKMLKDVDVPSWQAFLTSQRARRAFPCLGSTYSGLAITPMSVYRRLDHHEVGSSALSDVYLDTLAPGLEHRARYVFEAVRGQYRDDIAASAFSDDDRRVLSDAIASAHFTWARHQPDDRWVGVTSPDASYLANMEAMRHAAAAARIDAIRNDAVPLAPPWFAHEDMVGILADTGELSVSPASLQGLPEDREGQWATLGFIFGHELGHLVNDARGRLSSAGKVLLDRENEAIRQRYDGLELGSFKLNATATLDENSSDLRSLGIAYRLGLKHANAVGEAFDGARFYEEYAKMVAANPTAKQLGEMQNEPHAPHAIRANTAMQVRGFGKAFNCPPGPRLPVSGIFGGAMAPANASGSTG